MNCSGSSMAGIKHFIRWDVRATGQAGHGVFAMGQIIDFSKHEGVKHF